MSATSLAPPVAGGPNAPPALEMRGIDKSFPGVHALRGVDLTVGSGEILGLVGENGAGKSTLIKILAGAYARDAGEIRVAGESVPDVGTHEMIARGVAVIYQEPSLAPHLTVAENVFMGHVPLRRGMVDWARLYADTRALAERLGLDLEPKLPVSRLSVARRQMVEIAKALSREARIIVLDEPSAVLGDAELQGLFAVMRRLAADGVAFIYISHRLDEVFQITQRVTVLKDGRLVGTAVTRDMTHQGLVRMMVGRDVGDLFARSGATPGRDALRVRGLTRAGVLQGIDLHVREGEILGIAGMAGSGRTEVLRAIHGADAIDAGTIEVFGAPVKIGSSRDAIALGIGLLPEDRKHDGLLLLQTVAANVTISRLGEVMPGRVLRPARERRLVERYIERLAIRTPGPSAPVSGLSGGNQQKVVFAKWLHAACRILLIDEPTRGVDVAAKREIHQLLTQLARQGVAIVMVSSELPEVLGVSDRILVMREGRVAAELGWQEASEERIMHYATHHVG